MQPPYPTPVGFQTPETDLDCAIITSLGVPLAAGVLAPIGFVLPTAIGALLISASTVVVAVNAQALRRLDLRLPAVSSAAADRATDRVSA